jgi:choline-glycine betaine transporter
MKLIHQIFGIIVFVIFLLTGQYMDLYHNHLRDMPDGPRMLFRSRHIYILLAGLINIGIGSYLINRTSGWRRILQWIGSALIFVATILLIAAFFYEPKLLGLQSPITSWGIYSIFGGTMLHFISGLEKKSKT